MPNREQIITGMCYTWRHDFGLDRNPDSVFPTSGVTPQERDALRRDMSQLYDHHVHPIVHELEQLQKGHTVVLPQSREHAESMLRVAQFYLDQNK